MNNLLQEFLSSPFGNQAMQTLQADHGLPADKAQQAIGVVTDHAQDMMQKNQMDPNAVASQFGTFGNAAAGGIGGVLAGGGVRGAVEGGIGGVVAGRAAEILAEKVGMDPRTASSVAAIAAPFLLRFLHQHLQGQNAQPGQGPAMNAPNMPSMPEGKGGSNLPQMPYDQTMPANAKAPMAPGAKDVRNAPSQQGDNLAPWKRFL